VKREVILILALIAGACMAPGPALAHHGTAGYSMDKVVALNGTVTKFDWNNPHCIIYMDAKRENGDVEHWVLELGAPVHMMRVGWTKTSLKPGDQILAETHPAKNGATVGATGMQSSVLKVIVNGQTLPTQ
jgi:hypothetical protein